MLLLSRHKNESIMVGNDVEIFVIDIQGGRVRLGIKAPRNIPVHRREIFDAIERGRENKEKEGNFLKWKINRYYSEADTQRTNTTDKRKKYRGAM